jgi:hypothetical protein
MTSDQLGPGRGHPVAIYPVANGYVLQPLHAPFGLDSVAVGGDDELLTSVALWFSLDMQDEGDPEHLGDQFPVIQEADE